MKVVEKKQTAIKLNDDEREYLKSALILAYNHKNLDRGTPSREAKFIADLHHALDDQRKPRLDE